MAKGKYDRMQRYKDKTYKRVIVYLRKEDDKDILDWLEKNRGTTSATDVFRKAMKDVMKKPSE